MGPCAVPRALPSGRRTNVTLLAVLLLAFATGVGAVATGSAHGRSPFPRT